MYLMYFVQPCVRQSRPCHLTPEVTLQEELQGCSFSHCGGEIKPNNLGFASLKKQLVLQNPPPNPSEAKSKAQLSVLLSGTPFSRFPSVLSHQPSEHKQKLQLNRSSAAKCPGRVTGGLNIEHLNAELIK